MPTSPNSFYQRTRDARKIIVVDLGFLGDSIHLIPALAEIKRHYPNAELHTLSAPVGREVMALTAGVDRAWTFPLGPQSPPWWRHWDVIRDLRREKFDVAFNFSGADRTIFLTALTGARWRIGHPGGRRHFYNSWLIPEWVSRQSQTVPVYEQRRRILAECGLTLSTPRFELKIPDKAHDWAKQRVPSGTIHLSINASTHRKEWPLEQWIALTQQLLATHPDWRFVATGSRQPREQERLRALSAGVDDPRLQVLTDTPSLAQLGALLQQCRLHVGADSGVLHLAVAAGIPTVAIFRDYTGAAEWLPTGAQHRHVISPCPCERQGQLATECERFAVCLAKISPTSVAAEIEALLVSKA